MGRVAGKVAVVTGAASGIGAAIARAFVDEGAKVLVADLNGSGASAVAESLGEAAESHQIDVSQAADWAEVMGHVESSFGRLDVLVNTAGFFRPAPLALATEQDLRRMFEVNQLGTFLGMKSAIEPMRRSGGGSIINMSSVAGLQGTASLAGYSSTKFAIRGLTRCAALELGHDGIRVNSIHPGGIDTPMVARTAASDAVYGALPVPRVGRPDEVAAMALFLASDESAYCTGAEFVIDGGMATGVTMRAVGAAGT